MLALAGCGGSSAEPKPPEPAAVASCDPPRVNRTPYPGGDERMSTIPWIRGEHGLVGLLWYWPEEWDDVDRAEVFTGGVAPAGYSAKVLWAFLDPSARDRAGAELVIEARRLDGPGRWRETFGAISYEGQEGAPSYASILDLGRPGCWRLTLTTGDLRAHVDIRAVRMSACKPARVRYSDFPGNDDPPWVRGSSGLAGALGYWPDAWRHLTRARVYTHGRAPGGIAAKTMWAFFGPDAADRAGPELVIEGRNLDGPGEWRESFAEIWYEGQNGVPSYVSILDLPEPGCWRLTLTTGDLRSTVDVRAVEP
jgi:hypothetical protein